jgi:DNA-binding IclR family transcriptional regulator
LKQYTDNTIVSKKKYRETLEMVRQTGIALDNGERYEDTRAIGAPILNKGGTAVAAVVIAGPAFRLTDEFMQNVRPMLIETAEKISQRLFS